MKRLFLTSLVVMAVISGSLGSHSAQAFPSGPVNKCEFCSD